MRLEELHIEPKSLSVVPLKKGGEGTMVSIKLESGGELPDHKTQVEAILIAVSGETVYSTEHGEEYVLKGGDYVIIEPGVLHKLLAKQPSLLVLMK